MQHFVNTTTHPYPAHFTVNCTLQHSSAPCCIALHCISLHCTLAYNITLHYTALYWIGLHCTASYCILLHLTALHCIVQCRIALHYTALYRISLHCVAFYCMPVHCITFHCIVLYRTGSLLWHDKGYKVLVVELIKCFKTGQSQRLHNSTFSAEIEPHEDWVGSG